MFLSHFYSRCVLVCVAMWTLVDNSRVSAAPNFDPNMIYLPDQLDELRQRIAYEECNKNPTCNPDLLFGTSETRCIIGDGVNQMIKEMVDTRSNSICNPFIGEVFFPATGECVQLLTQGPCSNGFWVKLRVPDLVPTCEPQPCRDDQAVMENKCMPINDDSMCPPGRVLLNNEFGMGECDCAPGTAYHALTQTCYAPYSQGPCPQGQVIKVLDIQGGGKAECMPNLCPAEKMVKIDDQCKVQDTTSDSGTCYYLDTPGPCNSGILAIDALLLEPVCFLQTETHSIFNLPNRRGCGRGSIRDHRGRCRRNVSKIFGRLPPLVPTRPGTPEGGICPEGQTLLGGFCYRLQLRTPKEES